MLQLQYRVILMSRNGMQFEFMLLGSGRRICTDISFSLVIHQFVVAKGENGKPLGAPLNISSSSK
jgi:hypothetical protein